MTDWIALVIAIAAFMSAIWQIARTEGMREPEVTVMHFDRWATEEPGSGYSRIGVSYQPVAGGPKFNVQIATWGSARLVNAMPDPDDGLVSSSCLEPERVVVRWKSGDEEAYVGFVWHRPSYFRGRAVRSGSRASLETSGAATGVVRYANTGSSKQQPTHRSYQWVWPWYAVLLPKRFRKGKWKPLGNPYWRSEFLPTGELPIQSRNY